MSVVISWNQDQDQEKEMLESLLGGGAGGAHGVFGLLGTYNSIPKQDTNPLYDLPIFVRGASQPLCSLACPAG